MTDVDDRQDAFGVINFINNSIIADAEPPAFAAPEPFAVRRTGIESELANCRLDFFTSSFVKRLKLAFSALQNQEGISYFRDFRISSTA